MAVPAALFNKFCADLRRIHNALEGHGDQSQERGS